MPGGGGFQQEGGSGGDSDVGGSGGDSDVEGTGGGVNEECGDAPSTCTPQTEVCHPKSGTMTQCDECGQPVDSANGAPCARIVVTDKESNAVCIVTGERSLHCFPTWLGNIGTTPTFEAELPDDIVRVVPMGDGAQVTSMEICALTAQGALYCRSGGDEFVQVKESGCTDVAVTDDPIICALCDGATSCDDTSALEGEIAVDAADNFVYRLTEEGVYQGALEDPVLVGSFVDIAANHDGAVCGLTETGGLDCTADVRTIHAQADGPFAAVSMGQWPHVCGVDAQGRGTCFNMLTEEEVPLPNKTWVSISSSTIDSCGLTVQGQVLCWTLEGDPIELPSRYNR